MKQTFYGGVHPNDRKGATRDQAVKPLSAPPKQVVIAMSMHIGAPLQAHRCQGRPGDGGTEDR